MQIPWTKHVSNDEISEKIKIRKLIRNTSKSQLEFIRHIIRKKAFENLMQDRLKQGGQRKSSHNEVTVTESIDSGTIFRRSNENQNLSRAT